MRASLAVSETVVIEVQPETANDAPAEPGASAAWRAIRPVHTRVPGRARFKIPRLYRSERLKRRLETRLSAIEGVRSVQANVLTGSLKLVFSPSLTVDDLIRLIAAELGVKPPVTIDPDKPRARPKVRESVAQIVDLLRARPGVRLGIADAGAWHGLGPNLVGQILAMLRGSPGAGQGANEEMADDAGGDRGPPLAASRESYNWHRLSIQAVLDEFTTSAAHGLTVAEAEQRLARFGPNLLPEPESRSELAILVDQIATLPVAMLAVSAAISIATAGYIDAVVILGVVVINAIIGFFTERQSERTIRALTSTAPRSAHVLRNGLVEQAAVGTLVPGDVLLLSPGSYVAADLRLVQTDRLTLDESALTGESMPVAKDGDFIASAQTPLAERFNMAFMGTMVTGGGGRGVVVGTGTNTELGQIQSLVTTAEAPETPMQRQLGQMGRQLGILSGVVCAGVFGVGLLRGYTFISMLKSSVSLAVAAVPEGLTAVATTTLALGIKKMRGRRVAVRHLDAVENLGSVQVFCLDKTGTLTLNHMSVTAVSAGGRNLLIRDGKFLEDERVIDVLASAELQRLLEAVSLCSETRLVEEDGSISLEGSPTENALVEMAMTAGLDVPVLRRQRPQLVMVQRAEGRPYMSTTHAVGEDERLIAVKGSPAEVLALCSHHMHGGERSALEEPERSATLLENDRMAGDALRVLGVAYKERKAKAATELRDLTWLGLVGMADPLRSGMPELMKIYHRAGIETVMITGDQSATAVAIGKELGLSGSKPLEVLDSSALEKLDPNLLAALVKKVNVFARVTPAHKLRIVQALQNAGYVVAMTGDGINDGPALKAADVGVAMGEAGTDVARSVADVVLEDDNLHTMAVAVSEGRSIYNNVRKTIDFMVATNVAEIEIMLAAIAAGLGEPLNPMQLLWINLVTDIFPGLALSLEPAEPSVMEQAPRDPQEEIIRRKDLGRMAVESGFIGAGTLASYLVGLRRYGANAPASTLAFNTMVLAELLHSIRSRSNDKSIFSGEKLPPNKYLNLAVGGTLAVQLLAMSIPAVRRILGSTRLGLLDYLVVAAGAGVPFLINESLKRFWPKERAKLEEDEPAGEQPGTEPATNVTEGSAP